LDALVEIGEIVRDVALEPDTAGGFLICDRENLDMLLRLSRKKAQPVVKERSAALLVPFLALHSGLWFAETGEGGTARDSGSGGESAAVFPYNLTGFSAPAKLWETEFLAARAGAYGPEIIDRETAEGRLLWYGAGKGRVGFCRPEDTDLVAAFHENAGTDAEIFASGFFDRPRDFWEIKEALAKEKPGINSRECAEILWQAVWRGRLSADTFEPVRRGVEFGFVPKDVDGQSAAVSEAAKTPFMPGRHPRLPRALRDRWRTGAPAQGRWFSLDTGASLGDISGDPLDEECLNRDRVRLLLARYGLLCRPLLEHETPPFTWSGLLPAIRRMELAGELITGRFFSGINSPQFASPSVIRELERTEAFHGIYWMNAVDPASPAGRSVEGLPRFCDRVPGSRLYFKGTEIIAVSNRNGKELRIFTDPGDSDTVLLVSLFAVPRTRKVLPESKIVVEKINGKNAARGEYRAVFENAGFVFDREKLCLW
jgi:ATP-dependent Lhr-like helicase